MAQTHQDSATPASPIELLRARQFLESHMARMAVGQGSDADLVAIAEACEVHQNAAYGEAKESMDFRFHMAIAKATQNRELLEVAKSLWQRRDNNPLWRRLHDRICELHYRERWVLDHQKIVLALQARDGDAA